MIASTQFAVLAADGSLITGADDAAVANRLMLRIKRAVAWVRVADGAAMGRKQLPTELACPHPGNGFGHRGQK